MTDESGATERKRDHGEIVIEELKSFQVTTMVTGITEEPKEAEDMKFWQRLGHSELVGAFGTVQQAEKWLREKIVAGEVPMENAKYRIIRVVRAGIEPKIEQKVRF